MFDIKTIECGQQQTQQQQQPPIQTQPPTHTQHTTTTPSAATHPTNTATATAATTTPLHSSRCAAAAIPSQYAANISAATHSYSTCTVIASNASAATKESAAQGSDSLTLALTACHAPTVAALTAANASPHMSLLSLRRRRWFQRQACLLSIVAAFVFGLVLGVFVPMLGLANVFSTLAAAPGATTAGAAAALVSADSHLPILPVAPLEALPLRAAADALTNHTLNPPSDFPTIYALHADVALNEAAQSADVSAPSSADNAFSVAFIKEHDVELSAEEVFRNAFHLEQDKHAANALIVKKLDASDGSIKEFRVQRTAEGRFLKGPERRLSKPSLAEQVLQDSVSGVGGGADSAASLHFVPMAQRIAENARNQRNHGIIKSDIYWGDLVERALPQGFSAADARQWNRYVATQGVVERLEPGCGRMQNRLVVFSDGTRACARYRQNTDQIQGELFSFYLGQLLNMSNLAPSAAAVVDLESRTWSAVVMDITQAQWKQQRPVVLTRWLPDLEPAGIPQPFQPLERHLNKYDVWNITLAAAAEALHDSLAGLRVAQTSPQNQKGLLKRLGAASSTMHDHQSASPELSPSSSAPLPSSSPTPAALATALNATSSSASSSPLVLQRLIELAQWSDLIVFDYLIANLDRVVNNLYNFQWNADIMAAPAHNLARQLNSQLLVFLDNESGLLHGYRLLKKYEAYHGLLLDNLCVFRQPTIEALRELRAYGAGRRLREVFERTTSAAVRDVLPTLPDKSIKILVDRIDRVLGQVQKCRDLLTDR